MALATGQAEQAARLHGAVDALHEAMGFVPGGGLAADLVRGRQAARAALGDDRYDAAWEAGRALPLPQAMDEAAAFGIGPAPAAPVAPPPFGLTPRELEVLRLLAEGRSNDEVAAALFISTRTVATHVGHILAKLGVESRSAAVGLAVRRGIA